MEQSSLDIDLIDSSVKNSNNSNDKGNKRCILISSTILYSSFLILHYQYLDERLKNTHDINIWLQSKYSYLVNLIFSISAFIGDEFYDILLVVMAVSCRNRIKYFTYLINYLLLFGIFQVMKLQNHQERPYWVNEQIDGLSCETGFGLPSGHSTSPVYLSFAFYLEYLDTNISNKMIRSIVILVLVSIQAVVVVGRLYLGVHSLNQVVFGTFLGMYWCVIYYCVSRQYIYYSLKYYSMSINNSLLSIGQLYQQRFKSLLLMLLQIIIITLIIMKLHQHVDSTFIIKQEWIHNMQITCKRSIDPKQPILKGFSNTVCIFSVYGFFIGIIIQSFIKDYKYTQTVQISRIQMIIKQIVLIPISFLLPYLLQSQQFNNVDINYFFKPLLMKIGIPILYFMFSILLIEPLGIPSADLAIIK